MTRITIQMKVGTNALLLKRIDVLDCPLGTLQQINKNVCINNHESNRSVK